MNTLLNMALILAGVAIGDHFFNHGLIVATVLQQISHYM